MPESRESCIKDPLCWGRKDLAAVASLFSPWITLSICMDLSFSCSGTGLVFGCKYIAIGRPQNICWYWKSFLCKSVLVFSTGSERGSPCHWVRSKTDGIEKPVLR